MRRAVFNMRDERPAWAPPADLTRRLRETLPVDWELVEVAAPVSGRGDGGGSSPEAMDAIRGAEIYFGLGLPHDILAVGLEAPRRLRWIHTGAAGVASLLHPELIESGIVLTNSAGIHAAPIAETAIGMMLHFARGLDHAVHAQQESAWRPDIWERSDSGVRELAGATLGIVGFGGIGRAVAQRARALGMRVAALRRTRPPAHEQSDGVDVELITGQDALGRLLEMSDFLVLAVPATPKTSGMLGAREIARLRAGAVLINVARGSVIDETALIDALRAGRLRGAGLDVFVTEPLPAGSPLWAMPNVLITPHVSATSTRFWEREGELILDNLRRYLTGRDLINIVDTEAGY
ncbi:MAG TPA: D-2-hydroxyacid dehydrogenase [Longimicrobiales bacterium]|nr:D-2-hydroxyacid dehydrogenase [Longimicrobiales bacterium]